MAASLESLFAGSLVRIAILDPDLTIAWCNPAFAESLAETPDALRGDSLEALAARHEPLRVLEPSARAVAEGAPPRAHTLSMPDGCLARFLLERSSDGAQLLLTGRPCEADRASMNGYLSEFPTVAWAKTEDGRYAWLSKAFQAHFRIAAEAWLGKTDAQLWPAETAAQFRENDLAVLDAGYPQESLEAVPDPDGAMHQWSVIKFPFSDESGQRYVGGVGFDVTEREASHAKAVRASMTDDLTGLLNRRGFLHAGRALHESGCAAGDAVIVFFCDLDRLKLINDELGHDAGDRALRAYAGRLRSVLPDGAVIGRIGGDEFAAVVCAAAVSTPPEQLAASLGEEVEDVFRETDGYRVCCSVGYIRVSRPDTGLEQALIEADRQLRAAKRGAA